MMYDNERDIENLRENQQNIDDLYYEVFRLLQSELEKTVDRYPNGVPTEHIRGILTATDMFFNKNYGHKKGKSDTAGEGEL